MEALTTLDARLVQLVSAYSERVRGAVLAQHERATVYSPFEIVTARERFSPASPWYDEVNLVLCTQQTMDAAIADTDAAGTVAVFEAVAQEDLTVLCVIADPSVSRERVFDAAHQLIEHIRVGEKLPARSLFDLPVGQGHSWSIAERERPAWQAGQRFETITEAALPAWQIQSTLDLLASEAFAADAATAVLETMTAEYRACPCRAGRARDV